VVPSVPISRRESEVLRPIPASRGTGRGSTDPLTHSPSEQTAVHALLGSHQLQASHVVNTPVSHKNYFSVAVYAEELKFKHVCV
jgi:hypothetical protein